MIAIRSDWTRVKGAAQVIDLRPSSRSQAEMDATIDDYTEKALAEYLGVSQKELASVIPQRDEQYDLFLQIPPIH